MEQAGKTVVIARYTFQELVRSKFLWNVGVLGLVLAGVTLTAAEFAYGVPARIAVDLGLAFCAISGYGLAFFAGVPLVRQEEDSRTIYLIISRPVSREAFLLGKVLGVTAFLTLNFVLVTACVLLAVTASGGELPTMGWYALVANWMECVMLLATVVLISLLANRALTILGGVALLVAGHSVAETAAINFVRMRPWLHDVVTFYDWVLPGFHRFNLKDYVLYQAHPGEGYFAKLALYWSLYTMALLAMCCWLVRRKDFD